MSDTSTPVHSTGRGGAGNIGSDAERTYVDGDIVREGTPGVSTEPEYSVGRGGAGNIAHADKTGVASQEIVPESATRETHLGDGHENFHTGRGGGGNVHKEKYGGHSGPQKEHGKESLIDKAKHAMGMDKKEKTPEPSSK